MNESEKEWFCLKPSIVKQLEKVFHNKQKLSQELENYRQMFNGYLEVFQSPDRIDNTTLSAVIIQNWVELCTDEEVLYDGNYLLALKMFKIILFQSFHRCERDPSFKEWVRRQYFGLMF